MHELHLVFFRHVLHHFDLNNKVLVHQQIGKIFAHAMTFAQHRNRHLLPYVYTGSIQF